jgi:hypothetical protein
VDCFLEANGWITILASVRRRQNSFNDMALSSNVNGWCCKSLQISGERGYKRAGFCAYTADSRILNLSSVTGQVAYSVNGRFGDRKYRPQPEARGSVVRVSAMVALIISLKHQWVL